MPENNYFTVYCATLDSFVYKAPDGKYKAGLKGKITPHKFQSVIEAREVANNLTSLLKQAGMFQEFSVITR